MELLDNVDIQETDSLASLEERIVQAVQLVTRLRQEKEAAIADKQAALQKVADLQSRNSQLSSELETVRAERKQVRVRIEKLLGQIDQLSGA